MTGCRRLFGEVPAATAKDAARPGEAGLEDGTVRTHASLRYHCLQLPRASAFSLVLSLLFLFALSSHSLIGQLSERMEAGPWGAETSYQERHKNCIAH